MSTIKKKRITKAKAVRRVRRVKKMAKTLEASALGVSHEHLLDSRALETPLVGEGISSVVVSAPLNLPMERSVPKSAARRLREPLVPARVSFWLGVGFGMLVVGTLMVLAWELLQVETVQAVVLGLRR